MSRSDRGNVCRTRRTPSRSLANSMPSQVNAARRQQNEALSRRISLRIRSQNQIKADRSGDCLGRERQLVAPTNCGVVKRKVNRIKCQTSRRINDHSSRSNERLDVSRTVNDLTCSCNQDISVRCNDYKDKLEPTDASLISVDQREQLFENKSVVQDLDLDRNQRVRTATLDSSVSLSRSEGRPLRYRNCEIQTLNVGDRNGRNICNKHMPWFVIDV